MLSAARVMAYLAERGFGPYVGVPCSFLSPLINCIVEHNPQDYLTANNEGEAVAIASGAYLAGRRPVVILQNSGLGNAVNPLTSLNYVFRIPLLLIITWRGEPNTKDEPQHYLMGKGTRPLLDVMHISHDIFPEENDELESKMRPAILHMRTTGLSYALILRKGVLANYNLPEQKQNSFGSRTPGVEFHREPAIGQLVLRREAIKRVLDTIPAETVLVATTGKTARELAELEDRPTNFYVIGSMGCASSVALGIAMYRPERQVIILDGDGAALMRLEAMASLGHYRLPNLIHIVLDNDSYESTGGQRTLSSSIDFPQLAIACGYCTAGSASTLVALDQILGQALRTAGPHLLHFRIRTGSDPNLARPTIPPPQLAARFREAVGGICD
jgi:phosphonopyruvate decarboxylase